MVNRSDAIPPQRPVIAIDGPVASGKSSVGRAVAARLGLRFLDTGIMYRAVTWLALQKGEPTNDPAAVGSLAERSTMSVSDTFGESVTIIVDGYGLTGDDLASPDIDQNVSAVAAVSQVRRALVQQQREIANQGGIAMAGRDIGSVVAPDADVKLYIDASPEERARRRLRQRLDTDPTATFDQALADTLRRDELDSQRADSPLVVPSGAVVINTDGMNFDATVDAVVAAIEAALKARLMAAESQG